MLFDSMQFITRAFHGNKNGVGIFQAFAGKAEFAGGHAAVGEQVFIARRKRTAIASVMMQVPLEGRDVARAIGVAAAGHGRGGEGVEAHPERGLAGVGGRGIEFVAVDVLDDFADFLDEKFIFDDLARGVLDGLADFAREERMAARYRASEADFALHLGRDADFVGEFFGLGVDGRSVLVEFLVNLETIFRRHDFDVWLIEINWKLNMRVIWF